MTEEHSSEHQAGRAAKRVGLRACKSRWRAGSVDNLGGFQILDLRNRIVAGEKFDCTADDVVEFCARHGEHNHQISDRNESEIS